jgi:hypothetical protein
LGWGKVFRLKGSMATETPLLTTILNIFFVFKT